jgi:hypothetical protein
MEDLGWKAEAGVKLRSPKGRAAARGLDARIRFQHTFMPAGDTSPKSYQHNQESPLTAITVSTALHVEFLASAIKPNRQA